MLSGIAGGPPTFNAYLTLLKQNECVGLLSLRDALPKLPSYDALGHVYADLQRFSGWHGSTPRWIKMAMQVLKLPGGEGGARGPYLMPPDDEMQKFTDGLLRLRIPEIDELARAAGLSIPG